MKQFESEAVEGETEEDEADGRSLTRRKRRMAIGENEDNKEQLQTSSDGKVVDGK